MKKYIALGAVLFLLACTASGPKKALDEMAKAMDDNNSQAFLAHIDMDAYSANFLTSMTQNNEALNSINAFGKMLGLGNLDQLLNSIVDVKGSLVDRFNRGVASGELMAQCRASTTPDCPWVPQSLRDAQVKEVGADAAIAKVTTPAQLTCWLALHKFGDKWLVVGMAVLEDDARALAVAGKVASPAATPGEGRQPAAKEQKPVSI